MKFKHKIYDKDVVNAGSELKILLIKSKGFGHQRLQVLNSLVPN